MPVRPLQSFDNSIDRAALPSRLAALRHALANAGLAGSLVPRADQHQNEYVAPSEERLAWLSGFTGSAGLALVLQDQAVLFVDGRYTAQAATECDSSAWTIVPTAQTSPEQWIAAHLPADQRIGYDPWLHTQRTIDKLTEACAARGSMLIAAEHNPIDAIWTDRPAPSAAAISIHPLTFAGEESSAKLDRLRGAIAAARADVLVVSDPHALAWLFNIRGGDVPHTPLPLGYALVPAEGRPSLFIAADKMTDAVRDALAPLAKLHQPDGFVSALSGMAGHRVLLDSATASAALHAIVTRAGGEAIIGTDPIARFKAIKNTAEMEGARAAHLRDGVALTRFLAWLSREAPRGTLTEIEVVTTLEQMRRDSGLLKDVSFPTIAGSGPHGAIVHYRVSRESNRRIGIDELLLIDSGAQYEDGTTDVTRTVAIGQPTFEMRDRFTRVLKGHIAIARAIFPAGTSGAQLDSFARQYLWQAGVDFDHGTGHGVGSYLSVHEGPARISKLGHVALESGMILSNEPGYYNPGAFGIRIENLVLVTPREIVGAERPMLCFETLTLAPIDRSLIDAAMMSPEEIAWLDSYHVRVRDALAPLLDADTNAWLVQATEPINIKQ